MTGEELKQKIKATGVSITEIAKRLNISQQSLSQALKAADIKTGLVEDVSRVLDKPIAFFFSKEASDTPSVSSVSSDKESLTLSDNTGPVLMQNGPGSHNNHQKVIGADGTCSGREMAMQATIELQKKMIEDRDNEIAFLRDMLRKGLD